MLSILVSHDGADLRMRSYTSTLENSADLILPEDAPKIVLDMRRKPGCASATMRSWQTKDMNCDRPLAMVAG